MFEEAIQLPRLGLLRLKERGYLPVNAHVLSATISHQAGRWSVSVQIREVQPERIGATAPPIGVDLGVKVMATISDGRVIPGPKALTSDLKKLRRANKRLHRRKQGSKNRKKAQQQVARVHARIAHIRADALHQTTSHLISGYEAPQARCQRKELFRAQFPEATTKQEERWQNKQIKKLMRLPTEEKADRSPSTVVIEDLNVSAMVKNRHLARAVSDIGMAELKRQLLYKAKWAGCEILVASRWFASSKTCSCCGWVDADLTLADRLFVCQECHMALDRDWNAAMNLELLASDVGYLFHHSYA